MTHTTSLIAPTVRLCAEPFDAAHEETLLLQGRTDIGALVCFTGLCRDEAGTLTALELEHYPGMAESEITAIAADALARWPLARAHRPASLRAHSPWRENRAGRRRRPPPRRGLRGG